MKEDHVMELADYFARQDPLWDTEALLLWSVGRKRDRIGERRTAANAEEGVHDTRDSARYALALLESGEPWRIDRAHKVLERLVRLQVVNPTDAHYGIWGHFAEEAPHQMTPADTNWADFIGAELAHILALHRGQLQPATCDRTQEALRHAALAIFRHNIRASYTNIAVLGAVVTAAAGELLDLPFLTHYARRRLRNVVELVEETGDFAEYNSPTYTLVMLEALERALLIVRDPEFLHATRQSWRLAWESLAARFHPSTGQLAGPMSRAHSDWLRPRLAHYLSTRTGLPIKAHRAPDEPAAEGAPLLPGPPCPPELVKRFSALPEDPMTVRTRFAVLEYSEANCGETVGTTWLTADACLGSANQEFAWTQRRPLLGYWRTPADPAVVLRSRMLLNGDDLAAAWCRQDQKGPRALSACWLSYDAGHRHHLIDKPANSTFAVQDLRMRVMLRGSDVHGRQLDESRYSLSAGDWRAVIHTAQAALLDQAARWELGRDSDAVWVDAVLYSGPERTIDFHQATLRLGWAVELLPISQEATSEPIRANPRDGGIDWRWLSLAVTAPTEPTAFGAARGQERQR